MLDDILQKLKNDIEYCTENLPYCSYSRGYIDALKDILFFIDDKLENTSYIGEFKVNDGDI